MLTKQDLSLIGAIVKTELVPVRKNITNLQKDITGLKKNVNELQTDVSIIKKDVKKLRVDLNGAINFFNREDLTTRKGINKTRGELGLNEVVFAG